MSISNAILLGWHELPAVYQTEFLWEFEPVTLRLSYGGDGLPPMWSLHIACTAVLGALPR
jgi:hypothetical protein